MRSYLVEQRSLALFIRLKESIPFLLFYLFQQAILIINPDYSFSFISVLFKTTVLFLVALLIADGIYLLLPILVNKLSEFLIVPVLFIIFFYFNITSHYQWLSLNECIGVISLLIVMGCSYFLNNRTHSLKNFMFVKKLKKPLGF